MSIIGEISLALRRIADAINLTEPIYLRSGVEIRNVTEAITYLAESNFALVDAIKGIETAEKS